MPSDNPPPAQIADAVVLIIILAALGIGLLSMLWGWAERKYAVYKAQQPAWRSLTIAHAGASRMSMPVSTPTRVASMPPPTDSPSAATGALPLRAWLDIVNRQPDKTPHVAASGPSGSGKTTLIVAALHDRGGRFVICTPKSVKADPWGGLPVVRLRPNDMSFQPIEQAVSAVYAEMLRRNAQNADVDDDWLTLVIDEYSTVIGKCPELKDKVLDMITLGRSSRIRVIILATETNVKAWGWEGRGEARGNVLFIECEEDTHRAVIFRWGKERRPINTGGVPRIAAHPLPAARWWTPPVSSVSHADDEADRVLAQVFGGKDGVTNEVTPFVGRYEPFSAAERDVAPRNDVSNEPRNEAVSPQDVALIAQLLTTCSPSEAAKKLPGYTPTAYKSYKAKVDYVQGLLGK